jgi:hypothetical protein
MIYNFELFDSGRMGGRLALESVTSTHACLEEAVDEAKTIMSRLTYRRKKSDICVIKDKNGNIISEIRIGVPRS